MDGFLFQSYCKGNRIVKCKQQFARDGQVNIKVARVKPRVTASTFINAAFL